MQLEDKIKHWFVIMILFIMTVIVSIVLIVVVGILPKSGISNDIYSGIIGGLIGATGAIIGGWITFKGVQITIRNQNKMSILDRYPDRIVAASKIVDFMIEIELRTKLCLKFDANFDVDLKYLKNKCRDYIDKDKESYLREAAKISRNAFIAVHGLDSILSTFIYGSKREGKEREDMNFFYEQCNKISETIEVEYLKLEEEYFELLKS